MNIVKDPIDELLKADANAHRDLYIDDAGFTLRVVDRLPTKSRSATTLRVAIPFGLTSAAAAFVALFAGGGNFLVDAAMDIATTNISSAAVAMVTIVVVMIAVSVAAVRDS
jgi:hypothetical protein